MAARPRSSREALELADFQKMNQIRARVDAIVEDKATAEALKPWYRQFCKRPTFNDEYLPTFNRPNVTLVDTKGRGVDRVTENGLVVDGVEYEVDCMIFATGFEVGTAYTRRAGYEIYGRGGQTLTEHWARRNQDAARLLQPRFSELLPPRHPAERADAELSVICWTSRLRHIAEVIQQPEQRQAQVIEPTAEAEADWVQTIRDTPNAEREVLQRMHAGLLQRRRQARSRRLLQRPLWCGAGGVLRPRARLAHDGRDEGAAIQVAVSAPASVGGRSAMDMNCFREAIGKVRNSPKPAVAGRSPKSNHCKAAGRRRE